jgi:hypothetical protein
MGFGHGEKPMDSEVSIHLSPLTPFSSAANMRSVQIETSTQLPASVSRLAVAGTGDT